MQRVGDTAPDVEIMDADGRPACLAELCRDRQAALVFVRYLGCIFCREQLTDLRRHAAEIEQAGLRLVVITPDRPDVVRAFSAEFQPPFPIVSDPRRVAYQAFGLTEGSLGQLLSPRIVARGVQATLRGSFVGRPAGGNQRQLPGAAIVDTDGSVLFHYIARDAADHVDAARLIREAQTIPFDTRRA